jgi:NitT/TauT family transport system permease protein/putative hydroxymethylpyrimidine transport system permease protein
VTVKLRRRLRWVPAALLLAALIGAWELYVDLGGVDPLVLSSPHDVAKAIYDDRSLLWSNFLVTAQEVLLGILVAAVVGLGLAIGIHFSRTLRRAVYPLLVASQAVPIPILAPILVFWLGFGILPKLVVIALVSFFSIVVTTLAALAAVDPDLIKLMRTFDATRLRTFRHIELPAAMPGVFTGARIAVAVAVIGAVLGEQTGGSASSNPGLGFQINLSLNQSLTARGIAAVVILSLFAIALFGLLTLAERLAVPWAYQSRGELSQ